MRYICFQYGATEKTMSLSATQEWRKEFGYTGKGGVIVICNGVVQGWVNELRDPDHWQPGCIAIDESGRRWEAVGGDNQKGAESWKLVLFTH